MEKTIALFFAFTTTLFQKLWNAFTKHNWTDNWANIPIQDLKEELLLQIQNEHWVDAAAYAMFIWGRTKQ